MNVGIDIVENERVRKALTDAFLRKVLSEDERKLCEDYPLDKKVRFVAGRFAVKEAIIKALSSYEVPEFQDLNITNDPKGKPEISYKDYKLSVSISHEHNYSVAMAVLEE
ncbi:MAG: holo-ACP synthase [Erysipelotrichaceae bacterium]|nr:holo-ACP synthase [Erysipelotrichaceae bacterium]